MYTSVGVYALTVTCTYMSTETTQIMVVGRKIGSLVLRRYRRCVPSARFSSKGRCNAQSVFRIRRNTRLFSYIDVSINEKYNGKSSNDRKNYVRDEYAQFTCFVSPCFNYYQRLFTKRLFASRWTQFGKRCPAGLFILIEFWLAVHFHSNFYSPRPRFGLYSIFWTVEFTAMKTMLGLQRKNILFRGKRMFTATILSGGTV